MTDSVVAVHLRVNEVDYPISVAMSQNLLGAIRNDVGLTGTKEGCDDCECGACMVLIDGQPVNSCSYLAVQAQGREVTTVEGLANTGLSNTVSLHKLQENILEAGGVQCGFCTPGMLMSASALLAKTRSPAATRFCLGSLGTCVAARVTPASSMRSNAASKSLATTARTSAIQRLAQNELRREAPQGDNFSPLEQSSI